MIKKNLRSRTVTFLLKGNKVMLGLKNKGFGKGYYLGIGGKVESDETIEQAAKREIEEEVEVKVKTVNNQGILNFYFPHIENESWNQQVHVFIVTKWEGEPKETEEISPEWFDKKEIP